MNVPAWNRDGSRGILPILNEVQNILLQNETEQTVKYDSTTGQFPYLETTLDQYQYDMPSDVWRVGEVLIDYPNLYSYDYDLLRLFNEYRINNNNRREIETVIYNNKKYVRIQNLKTTDRKSDTVPARVQFFDNPETSTSVFQYRAYTLPTQLTTEGVELTIPEKYHLSHVVPATLEMIEAFENNKWTDGIEAIKKFQEDIINEQNAGEQGEAHIVHRRDF